MNVTSPKPPSRHARRIPEDSVLFNWLVPAIFVLFGLVMIVIVAFAVGVLTGIIRYH